MTNVHIISNLVMFNVIKMLVSDVWYNCFLFYIYIILFECPFELNLVKKDNIKTLFV
jgi:hypothetical protein